MLEDYATVKAVLSGERERYRQLVEKYQGKVFAVITRITGKMNEAEDLAQETFWQAYRSLGNFRGEACFSTWLLRIAINKAIDYYRRHGEESRRLQCCDGRVERAPSSEQPPEVLLLAKERQEQLHGFLDLLPPPYRYVLRKHYLEGYTYREIARQAGIPLKTVESRLYRARKQLRALIKNGESLL